MADFINVLTEIRGKGATTGSVLDLSNSIPRTGDLIDPDGSDVETNRLYESNHSVYADIKNAEWKIGNYTQGFKEDKAAVENSGVQADMHTVAGMTSEITYLGRDSEGKPKIDMLYADLNDSNSLLNTVVSDVTAIKDEAYTYRTSALNSSDNATSARLIAETKAVDAEVAKRNAELYSSEDDDVAIRLWRNESNVPVLEPVASGGYSSKHWRNKAAGISTGTELTGKTIYDKSNKVAANSTVVKALGSETISAGTIVKITSESASTDNTTIVSPCTTSSDDVLGICVSTIDTVTSGLIVTHGSVMDIDTTAFTGELYIGPDGQLSNSVSNQSVGFVAKRDVSGMLYVTFSNANLNVYSKEYLDSKLLTVSESVQVYTGIVNGKLEMNSGNGKVKIGSEDMTVCIPGGYDNGYAVNTLVGTFVSSSFAAGSDLSFDTGYELKPNSTSYVFVDSNGLFRSMDSAPTKLGRARTRLGERIDAYRDGRWSVSNNGLNRINSGSLSDVPTDLSDIPSADWVSVDGGQLSSNLFSGDGVNTTSSIHRSYILEANTKYRLKYSANATTNGQDDTSKPFISISGPGVYSTITNYFSSGQNQINREFTSSALGGNIEFKLAVGGTASNQFELTEIELFEVTYKESYKYGTQNGVPSWASKKIAYLPYKITTDASALVTSVEYDAGADFIDLVGELDSKDSFFNPGASGLVSDNVHDALIELDSDVSTKANKSGDNSQTFKVADAVNDNEAVSKSQLDNSTPLGVIVAIASNLSGTYPIPGSGVVDSKGWMYCDGSAIPSGKSVSGNVPNLTDGRFLRGATSSGGTGGAESFVLSDSNLPSHTHTIDHNHGSVNTSSYSHSHTANHNHTGTVSSSGNHSHYSYTYEHGGTDENSRNDLLNMSSYDRVTAHSTQTSSSGAHSHTVSIDTKNFSTSSNSHSHSVDLPNFSGMSGSVGSSSAKTHIPKYVNVQYMIKVS